MTSLLLIQNFDGNIRPFSAKMNSAKFSIKQKKIQSFEVMSLPKIATRGNTALDPPTSYRKKPRAQTPPRSNVHLNL